MKLTKFLLVFLIFLSQNSQSDTVRIGQNGKLITDAEGRKRAGSDGKPQEAYSSGRDSLYKSNLDDSSYSYGNNLLKKCGESSLSSDDCLIKYKEVTLEFSGKVKDSKKGITIVELDNNELVDVISKDTKINLTGSLVNFSGKIKSIGSGRYVHHVVMDAIFQ